MLEVGAAGGDRLEPAIRQVAAAAEVEVLEVGATVDDLHKPGVRQPAAADEDDGSGAGEPVHQPGDSSVRDSAAAEACAADRPRQVDGKHELPADAKPPFAHRRDSHHSRPGVAIAEDRFQHLVGQNVDRHGDGV